MRRPPAPSPRGRECACRGTAGTGRLSRSPPCSASCRASACGGPRSGRRAATPPPARTSRTGSTACGCRVVHHQDDSPVGEMDVGHVGGQPCEVPPPAPVGDLHVAPCLQRRVHHEQVRRSVAFVPEIVRGGLAGPRRKRHPRLLRPLLRGPVHADGHGVVVVLPAAGLGTSSMAQTKSALSFGGMHQHSLRHGLMSFFSAPAGPSRRRCCRRPPARRACRRAAASSSARAPPADRSRPASPVSPGPRRPTGASSCWPAPSSPAPPQGPRHELPAGPLHRRRPGPEDVRDVGVPASAAVAVGVRQKQDVRPPATRHRPLSTVDDPLQERPLPVVQPYVIYLPATRSHGLPPHDAPGTAGGHPPDPEGLLVVGVAGIRYQGEHGRRTGINSTLAGY